MIELRVACDGGKDSLSMAAAAGGETVMAPGNLVVSAYVGVPDVTKVVTPDLKPGKDGGVLLHVDLGRGRRRLGGSALAQAHAQLGDESPDVSAADVGAAWRGVQAAIDAGLVRAGHDISDGGIVTALLEMAFAGELVFFRGGGGGGGERAGAGGGGRRGLRVPSSSPLPRNKNNNTNNQQGGCTRVTRVPKEKTRGTVSSA